MSEALGRGRSAADLDVNSLYLDALNPRLDIRATASQDQIRKALLATEDVFELIGQIHSRSGLLAGERIIVTKEGGRYVVLEGNRRTTAIQVMLKAALLTKNQQKRLPKNVDGPAQANTAPSTRIIRQPNAVRQARHLDRIVSRPRLAHFMFDNAQTNL